MHMFQSSWRDLSDFEGIFMRIKNTISGQPTYFSNREYIIRARPYCAVLRSYPEYVMRHWKEDFMFGYQFLNGCNPVVIRKCTKLPDKFPVTHEMVALSLERELTLEQEIEVDIATSVSVAIYSFVHLPCASHTLEDPEF